MTLRPDCMFSKFCFWLALILCYGSVLFCTDVIIGLHSLLNSISIKYFYFHKLIERTSKHANFMLYSSAQHENGLCVSLFSKINQSLCSVVKHCTLILVFGDAMQCMIIKLHRFTTYYAIVWHTCVTVKSNASTNFDSKCDKSTEFIRNSHLTDVIAMKTILRWSMRNTMFAFENRQKA